MPAGGAGANADRGFVLVGGQHGVLILISLGRRARNRPVSCPADRLVTLAAAMAIYLIIIIIRRALVVEDIPSSRAGQHICV